VFSVEIVTVTSRLYVLLNCRYRRTKGEAKGMSPIVLRGILSVVNAPSWKTWPLTAEEDPTAGIPGYRARVQCNDEKHGNANGEKGLLEVRIQHKCKGLLVSSASSVRR